MRAAGASPESLAAYRRRLVAEIEARSIELFPENWHAFSVFLRMGDQWRIAAGFGGIHYLGLDYAALPPVLEECRRLQHRQPMDRLMPQLRTLVRAARAVLNDD